MSITNSNLQQETISVAPEKGVRTGTIALIIIILTGSILITLIILAWTHIKSDEKGQPFSNAKEVINIMLPLIATWMGTVLAYYFSKENFKAASESNRDLLMQVTGIDKTLQSIKVVDVMVKMNPAVQTQYTDLDEFKTKKVDEILAVLISSNSERLPIVNPDMKFIFLIYRSTLERFIIGFQNKTISITAAAGDTRPQPLAQADLIINDLFTSDFKLFKDILAITNPFLPNTATLDDARLKLKEQAYCQDVFITKTGSKDEPVEGWITNDIIIEKIELFKTKQ